MLSNTKRKAARMSSGLPDTLNVRTYNLVLGVVVLYGFIVNAIMVATMSEFFTRMNPIVFLIGYFVSTLIGCFMAAGSHNYFVSFIGYNLVVLPIGGLLSICLPYYEGADILSAMVATGAVVGVMMVWATVNPTFFEGIGRTLFFSLLLGLIAEIVATMLGYGGNFFNWLFILVFSLYIGYDWSKAQAYPKTLDNAIDSALDIYLDIINLFIRILEIMGKKDD